jgi:hypothetical protein
MALRRMETPVPERKRKRRPRMAHLVIQAFNRYRDDSSAMLADRLNTSREHVRATLHRAGLSTQGRAGRRNKKCATHRDGVHA